MLRMDQGATNADGADLKSFADAASGAGPVRLQESGGFRLSYALHKRLGSHLQPGIAPATATT